MEAKEKGKEKGVPFAQEVALKEFAILRILI
jgi:hypothetical protein